MNEKNTIGQFLRKGREKKKISIEDVAKKTKININILKALEESDLENLPNKTYVKGFVQNYAKTVGLDEKKASVILTSTYQSLEPEPVIEPEELAGSNQDTPLTQEQLEIRDKAITFVHSFLNKKTLISLIGVVLIFLIGKGVIGFFSKISNEQVKIKPAKTEEQITSAEKSNDDIKSADKSLFDLEASKKLAEKLEEQVEKQKEADTAKQEVKKIIQNDNSEKEQEKENKEKKEVKTSSLKDGELPFVKFSQAPLKTFTLQEDAPENDNTELLPARIKNSAVSDMENVFINATSGDTWLSYKSDDNRIRRFVLKQGRTILIRGKVVRLFLGNVNVTKIFYNNKLISIQSRTGVKSLIFPPQAAKDFKLPLFPAYKGVSYTSSEYEEKMAQE